MTLQYGHAIGVFHPGQMQGRLLCLPEFYFVTFSIFPHPRGRCLRPPVWWRCNGVSWGSPQCHTLGRRRLLTVVCVVSLCHPLNLIRQRLEEKAAFPTVASHGTKQERASSLPLTWGADKQQKQHEAVCLLSLSLPGDS